VALARSPPPSLWPGARRTPGSPAPSCSRGRGNKLGDAQGGAGRRSFGETLHLQGMEAFGDLDRVHGCPFRSDAGNTIPEPREELQARRWIHLGLRLYYRSVRKASRAVISVRFLLIALSCKVPDPSRKNQLIPRSTGCRTSASGFVAEDPANGGPGLQGKDG
jgi:hypothetical protein